MSRKWLRDERGIAPLAVVGICAVLLTAAGLGLYWVTRGNESDPVAPADTSESTPVSEVPGSTNEPSASTQTPDPYTNWETYKDAAGRFSFKYPKDWLTMVCDGDTKTVYFGTDRRNIGFDSEKGEDNILCDSGGTDFPPQALITIRTKDSSGNFYTSVLKGEAVTIDGKPAVRARKVFTQQDENNGDSPKGFVMLTYQVKLANDKLMTIQYNQWPNEAEYWDNYDTDPKNEQMFETIVTKTLDIL